jgi:hypothetical protein
LTIDRTILILINYAKHDEARKILHGRLAIVQRLFEKTQTQKKSTLSVDVEAKQAKS